MKKNKMMRMVFTILCGILFNIGCSNENIEEIATETNSETAEMFIMEDVSAVKAVKLEYPEKVLLEFKNEEWQTSDLEEIDQRTVNLLFSELFSLTGTLIDETPISEDNETLFSFIIYDGEGAERSYSLISDENGNYFVQGTNETYYKVDDVPEDILYFNKNTLRPAISLLVDEPTSIKVTHENYPDLLLNQETQMNEVEKSPFISGWFLHGPFETEFSIEYQEIEKILKRLKHLKGTKSPSKEELNSKVLTITIGDEENQEILKVAEKDINENFYNVYIESHGSIFEIPAYIIEQFIFSPLTVVDNFIAIIPVDSIQRIIIESTHHEKLVITINDENPIEILINGKIVEEELFRKKYQYLAMLSYDQFILKDDFEINPSDEVKITYEYGKDEENYRTDIYMQSIEGTDEYLVNKDGVIELTVKSDVLSKMFNEFQELIK